MFFVKNWNKLIVCQRHNNGCIPAGIEWILRYAGIINIEFDGFQEEFNLENRRISVNKFKTVAEAIQKKYPQVKFEIEDYEIGDGVKKIEKVKELLKKNIPPLYSITRFYGKFECHVMPVIGFDEQFLYMLDFSDSCGNSNISRVDQKFLIKLHQAWEEGRDLMWIPLSK
ncbi:MAG: hypothetical protein EAX96_07200 [Candidatus Lokiarchaeota archaeon]|nr:hypothetical protein [Candidatus Lokiarchaeota archaeon]